jgi:DNA-3-methyladenine glycosylase I
MTSRCWWCGDDPLYVHYHDHEWGFPVADDTRLFEKLCLEGFQSGLAWITILRKREGFRRAFAGFDMDRVAGFTDADVARLLADPGIVRHRGKIEATIRNAHAARRVRDRHGSLAAFVWRFAPDAAARPARFTREVLGTIASTPESTALSKALRAEGFGFVGPTTCYAFMQAMGMVNDHVEECTTRAAAEAARAGFTVPSR